MNEIEKSVDTLVGYMIGAQQCTIPKLKEWGDEFGKLVKNSKATIALVNNHPIPIDNEAAIRVFAEALSVRSGQFKRSKEHTLDETTKVFKEMVTSALKFHVHLGKGDD